MTVKRSIFRNLINTRIYLTINVSIFFLTYIKHGVSWINSTTVFVAYIFYSPVGSASEEEATKTRLSHLTALHFQPSKDPRYVD